MKYEVIATGSTGNCVILNDYIAIDMGVPFKSISAHVKSLKLVLLTHRHSDHFNPTTVRKLAELRPTLRFGCCEWMVPHLVGAGVNKRFIDVFTPGFCFIYPKAFTLMPEKLTHNVPNCGYHIWMGNESLFYATDTGTLDGIEAKGYDLYMVEANHTQSDIEDRVLRKRMDDQYAYEYKAAENHLSREQAEDWLYQNMGPRSLYVFLHGHKEK